MKTAKTPLVGKPFQKGQSGNPSGRPKMPDGLRAAIEATTPDAVNVLATIMRDPKEPSAARVRAAEILLKKAVPDLSTVDMTADIQSRTVYELSDKLPTEEEWEASCCHSLPT